MGSLEKETNARFDSLEGQIGSLNKRVESLEEQVGFLDKRVGSLEDQIVSLEKETNTRFDSLEGQVISLNKQVESLNKRVGSLEGQVAELKSGQDEIMTMLEELDPKNASRHLELKNAIEDLKRDLSVVEIVTASNYADIARLKRAE